MFWFTRKSHCPSAGSGKAPCLRRLLPASPPLARRRTLHTYKIGFMFFFMFRYTIARSGSLGNSFLVLLVNSIQACRERISLAQQAHMRIISPRESRAGDVYVFKGDERGERGRATAGCCPRRHASRTLSGTFPRAHSLWSLRRRADRG